MPPRRLLRRLHVLIRSCWLWFGVAYAIQGFARVSCLKDGEYSGTCILPPESYAATAPNFFLCGLILTKSNYGRFRRWLGTLGKGGGAEQKAASVASLLGGASVAEALTNAAGRFRAQPLKTLTLEALLTNESDPSLYANSVPAKLGEVHAFVSHSWSDDGILKYDKLHEWAHELGGDEDKLVCGSTSSAPTSSTLMRASRAFRSSCPAARSS